jgi:hypothetical protein
MADYGAPQYPIIHVLCDVNPSEPGIAAVHDQATGETHYQDQEMYMIASQPKPQK